MRAIHFGTTRHAEQLTDQFDFALDTGAYAHLRVDQFSVHLAEADRHRDLCVRFLSGIDPQIEQRARRLQLAPWLAALGKLSLEAVERLAPGFQHHCVVGAVFLLQLTLRFHQTLPTLLMLAMQTECGHMHTRHIVLTHTAEHAVAEHAVAEHAVEHRCDLLVPLVEARLAATGHFAEETRERIAATAHRLLPGTGDVLGACGTAGELSGDLLHHAEPLPGLRGKPFDRIAGIIAPGTAGELRPAVHRGLPRIPGGRRTASRTHRLAQRAPVLLCQCTRIRRPAKPRSTRTACSPHRIAPGQRPSS